MNGPKARTALLAGIAALVAKADQVTSQDPDEKWLDSAHLEVTRLQQRLYAAEQEGTKVIVEAQFGIPERRGILVDHVDLWAKFDSTQPVPLSEVQTEGAQLVAEMSPKIQLEDGSIVYGADVWWRRAPVTETTPEITEEPAPKVPSPVS